MKRSDFVRWCEKCNDTAFENLDKPGTCGRCGTKFKDKKEKKKDAKDL